MTSNASTSWFQSRATERLNRRAAMLGLVIGVITECQWCRYCPPSWVGALVDGYAACHTR